MLNMVYIELGGGGGIFDINVFNIAFYTYLLHRYMYAYTYLCSHEIVCIKISHMLYSCKNSVAMSLSLDIVACLHPDFSHNAF